MNFLGVGMGELLLILVIAMLVVGPERIAEVAGQMGRMLAKFREQSDSITREFKEAFTLELKEDAEAASDKAPPAVIRGVAARAAPAGDGNAPEGDGESTSSRGIATAAPAPSPEEMAAFEAVQLEQRLASDMVDGELEVVLVEGGVEGNGAAAEDDESYREVEPVDLSLAALVPEDVDVEPTTVNAVLVIPDEEAAELSLEAKE